MANQVKNYFLSPSWDYSPSCPPSTTIALWNIVSSPTKIVPPLAAASCLPAADQLGETTKQGFEWANERDKEKKFGVWTKSLSSFLSSGVSIGYQHSSSIHDLYSFEELVTREAYPTEDYLAMMVKKGAVRKYLERFDFKKPVYIVVGTKTVSGTNVKHVAKQDGRTECKLSVDLTLTGAPTSLAPGLDAKNKKSDSIEFKGSSDFVFAFRIRKILVSREFTIKDQDDVEGGALGDYDDEEEEAIKIQGLEERDTEGDDPALQEMRQDDGKQVFVTVLGAAQ